MLGSVEEIWYAPTEGIFSELSHVVGQGFWVRNTACHEVRERTWNARLLVTTVRGLSWSKVQATWVFCDSLTAFLEATQVADTTFAKPVPSR